MGKPLTDEQKQEIKAMWEAGVQMAQIARMMNLHRRTVMKTCRALGLPPRVGGGRHG